MVSISIFFITTVLSLFVFKANAQCSFDSLSKTGFFSSVQKDGYEPQYPLWSDGLDKRRWIAFPNGKKIEVGEDYQWIFPVGVKFWKEFTALDSRGVRRKIETRFMMKTENQWEVCTFLWSDSRSDALLAPDEGVVNYQAHPNLEPVSIPSLNQCWACHQRTGDPIQGFEYLQLSFRQQNFKTHSAKKQKALTVRDLNQRGWLTRKLPESPRIAARFPLEEKVLGYFHGNCGGCHGEGGRASRNGLQFRHDFNTWTIAEEPGFRTTVGVLSWFPIPDSETQPMMIKPGKPDESVVFYRMITNQPGVRMPPVGSRKIDSLASREIKTWIECLGSPKFQCLNPLLTSRGQ